MQTLDKIAPTEFVAWWGQVAKRLNGQVGVGRARDNIAVNVPHGVIYLAPVRGTGRLSVESWIESETEQAHHGFKWKARGLTPDKVAKEIKMKWGKHLWESTDDLRMGALEDVMLQEAENIRYRTGLTERQKVGPYHWPEENPKYRQGSFKVGNEWLKWIRNDPDFKEGPHMVLFQEVRDMVNKIPREKLPEIWGLDNIPDAQDHIAWHPKKAFQEFLRNVHNMDRRLGGYLRRVADNVPLVWYMVMHRIVGKQMADEVFNRYFTETNYREPPEAKKLRDKRRRKASSMKPGSQPGLFPEEHGIFGEAASADQLKQAMEMIIKMLDQAIRKAVGSGVKGFTGEKGGAVMGRWVQKSPKGEHTMIVRIPPRTTSFSVSTYTKHKGANIKPKLIDDVMVDMRRVWKGPKKYDWSPLVDLFKEEIAKASNRSVVSVESQDAFGELLGELFQETSLDESKGRCGREARGDGLLDGKGPHGSGRGRGTRRGNRRERGSGPGGGRMDGSGPGGGRGVGGRRRGLGALEDQDTLGGLLGEIRQAAGLEEARSDISDEQKADILKVTDAIKAQLKRQGIKRVRALVRRDERMFNVGSKSVPDAPFNRVELANMVLEPLVKVLHKMGGKGSGQPGPGASYYLTFPSGIRVIAGANTSENSVLIRVSGP